jgi:hypothetical protein
MDATHLRIVLVNSLLSLGYTLLSQNGHAMRVQKPVFECVLTPDYILGDFNLPQNWGARGAETAINRHK